MTSEGTGAPLILGYRRWLARRSSWILGVAGLVTIFFASALPRLEVENSHDRFALPAGDPVMRDLAHLRTTFGIQKDILIGLEFSRDIGPAELRELARLTEAASELPAVTRVASLANALWFDRSGFVPAAVPLYQPDADPESMAAAVRLAATDPLYARNLISVDGRRTTLLVEFSTEGEADPGGIESRLIDGLSELLAAAGPGIDAWHLAGLPLVDRAFERQFEVDLSRFAVLSAGFALAVLWFLFGALTPVAIAAALALAAIIWGLGILALSGTPMSMGLAMMIPLIMVLSTAYSIHYLSYILRPEVSALPREAAVGAMLDAVLPPSLMAGLTTAAGFLALNVSGLEAVRDVGTYIGLGVLAAVAINTAVLPALLLRVRRSTAAPRRRGELPQRLAEVLGHGVIHHTRAILATAILLAAVAAVGATRVQVDSNYLYHLRADEPVRQAYAFVDQHFGGSTSIELIIIAPSGEVDRVAGRISRLSGELRTLGAVRSVTSIVDLTAPVAAPGSAARAADVGHLAGFSPSVWERLAGSALGDRFLQLDGEIVSFRVAIRGPTLSARAQEALLEEIRPIVIRHLPGLDVVITGGAPIFGRTLDYLVSSQLRSFAIAAIVIMLLITALTRSLRVSALAMVANLLLVLLLLGAMGWLGIPIDFTTVIITSVVIGIAVDDTVHLLFRYLHARRRAASADDAILRALHLVGAPLITSSLVIVGGFLVLTLSGFVPIVWFGMLTALTVVAALVGDLVVLPALLKVSEWGR